MPNLLGLDFPNLLPAYPDWVRPAGRLIWSTLLLVVLVAGLVLWAKRGPYLRARFARSNLMRTLFPTLRDEPGGETTWAGAVAGAVLVFFMLILAYGVVPHEWLTFANGYLQWGADAFFVQDEPWLPFDVSREAVKDIVAAGLYIVFLVANVVLVLLWQKRLRTIPEEEAAAPTEAEQVGTSAYGRPVRARG